MNPTGDAGLPDAARKAWERIDADLESHLERIRRYLQQPSVSVTGDGIEGGAQATAELIEAAGGIAELVPSGGHPAVLGRIEGGGPRLLRYAMYDVQPADEDGWNTPPFAAEVVDIPGVGASIVARGSSNSKGCLAAFLLAIGAAREVGDLPVSLTLLVDGEEELGSPHYADVIASRRNDLEADGAFDLDLTADRGGTPEVYLGCKGILEVRLSCKGGDWGGPVGKALHSSQGAVVASPAWSLIRAVAALVGPDESPRLEGLARREIPEDDRPLLEELAANFDPNEHLTEANSRRFKRSGGPSELLAALIYEPVVNLNGIESGYPQGIKTIVPYEARAALDVRLPFGSDASLVAKAVERAVADVAPEVDVYIGGECPPARTSPETPMARAMIASHRDEGHPARVWPSAPWWAPYHLFTDTLGLPFASGGAGHSSGAHAANEYASVEGLRQHMRQSVALLHRFAQSFEKEERGVE